MVKIIGKKKVFDRSRLEAKWDFLVLNISVEKENDPGIIVSDKDKREPDLDKDIARVASIWWDVPKWFVKIWDSILFDTSRAILIMQDEWWTILIVNYKHVFTIIR